MAKSQIADTNPRDESISLALRRSWTKGSAEEAIEHIDAAIQCLKEAGPEMAFDRIALADEASSLAKRYGIQRPKGKYVIELCSDDQLEQPQAQCECIAEFARKTGRSQECARHIVRRAAARAASGKKTRTTYEGQPCTLRVVET